MTKLYKDVNTLNKAIDKLPKGSAYSLKQEVYNGESTFVLTIKDKEPRYIDSLKSQTKPSLFKTFAKAFLFIVLAVVLVKVSSIIQ